MRLVDNWPAVLRRAWSIRLNLLAGLFAGVEAAVAIVGPFLPIHPGVFAALSGIATCASVASRLVAQANLGDNK